MRSFHLIVLFAFSFASAGFAADTTRPAWLTPKRAHPRLFFTPENLPRLRERCANGDLKDWYLGTKRSVEGAIGGDLPPEPPRLPKEGHSLAYSQVFTAFRPPAAMMQRMGLVYALDGDRRIGADAKRRALFYFGFDPNGSTCTWHNDEPAMSIMRNGCRTYDWTYDLYSPEEREVIEKCILIRAKAIYDVLREQRFHVAPVDSHLGRQIGFLAEACLTVMAEHPEAQEWYDYAMNVYRTVYPAWSRGDGGWNEGPHYWLCYMDFGLDSLLAVRNATGEDIFNAKSFFRETPWYGIYQIPPGSPISPFGDGWQARPQEVGLMRSFAAIFRSPEFLYFARLYGRNGIGGVRDLVLSEDLRGIEARPPAFLPNARCFWGEGLVMSHSVLTNAAENVAFYFRSSPYGSVSHGHEDQNSFCIAAYGEPLAIATGYYNYWGSRHHFSWMHTTKAKCAITYDGGKGERRGAEYPGRITHFESEGLWARFGGDAALAYGGDIFKAQRDVVRLDERVFVMRDTLAARLEHSWEYNLHALDEMRFDEGAQTVTIMRPKASLAVRFVAPSPLVFSETSAFDPPVDEVVNAANQPHPDQWHFRASSAKTNALELYTVLEVLRPGEKASVASAMVKGNTLEIVYADGRRRNVAP